MSFSSQFCKSEGLQLNLGFLAVLTLYLLFPSGNAFQAYQCQMKGTVTDAQHPLAVTVTLLTSL